MSEGVEMTCPGCSWSETVSGTDSLTYYCPECGERTEPDYEPKTPEERLSHLA